MPKLKRFQIMLDIPTHEKLRREAFRRRVSVSSIIREMAQEWFKKKGGK